MYFKETVPISNVVKIISIGLSSLALLLLGLTNNFNETEHVIGFMFVLIVLSFVIWLIVQLKISSTVKGNRVTITLKPLWITKSFSIRDIETVRESKFHLLGIGYHTNFMGVSQFNSGLARGVLFRLKNKHEIYVSSNRPKQFIEAIQSLKSG